MIADHRLECIGCGASYSKDSRIYRCTSCGDLLTVRFRIDSEVREAVGEWSNRPLRSMWKYRELLPVGEGSRVVSLSEGATTLHRCDRMAERLGVEELYVKFEGENPTGSFKDRGMTVGVSKALELGARVVICASTGNTSASLSAYAAKAGLKCVVVIPSGKVALGKVAQAIIHGARVIQVGGGFDDALDLVVKLCDRHPEVYLLNSVNPYRLEGQKTIAYEILEQLGRVPDNVVVPVGNAGNISAIWKGFLELRELGLTQRLPRMYGIQASGANPVVRAVKRGLDRVEFLEECETVATAIRIGKPVNWKKALRAIGESGGTAEEVSDQEIMRAQAELARTEGIFVEPASAASIAGLRRLLQSGIISVDEVTVCVATGHGLKDPEIIVREYGGLVKSVDWPGGDLERVEEAVLG